MNAASGTARTGQTRTMGRTRTTAYPHPSPRPFPAAPIIMLAGTRLKDACGAGDADRATARSLTRPPARTNRAATREREDTGPARYALQTAHRCETPGQTPLDAGPLLQG
jgi:hypothetical protein